MKGCSQRPECHCLRTNTHAHTQTMNVCLLFFVKGRTMTCSGQRGFCTSERKGKGVVASVSISSSLIFYHHDTFLYLTFHPRSMLYTVFVKRGAAGALFHSMNFCNLYKKIPPPNPKVSKSICFSHLHSRIDFFSIFIPKRMKKKWHSETFYSIFIRSCGPKVQRFGWNSLFNVYVTTWSLLETFWVSLRSDGWRF